jgi:hypothetical protein
MKQKKYEVRQGVGILPRRMTLEHARRYANRIMPGDLRRAGFVASVYLTCPEIHGGEWIRINFSK